MNIFFKKKKNGASATCWLCNYRQILNLYDGNNNLSDFKGLFEDPQTENGRKYSA